jgi:hypothetical protein
MNKSKIHGALASVILLASTAFGQSDNITWVNMYLEDSWINNIPDRFDLEISVSGNDIGSCTVTPPTGPAFDLTQISGSPDTFVEDGLISFNDPSGSYGFVIDPASGQDSFSLSFSPISSLEYIHVWNPTPLSTDVSLSQAFYWNPITAGQEIYVELYDWTIDQEVENTNLAIGATNWQPTSPLEAGHFYSLELKIEYGDQVVPHTSLQGDSFQYSSGFARGNSVLFQAEQFELSTDELPGGWMDFDVTGCTPGGIFAICVSTGTGSHSFSNPLTGSTIITDLSSFPFLVANISVADPDGEGSFSTFVPGMAAGLAHLQGINLHADTLTNVLEL